MKKLKKSGVIHDTITGYDFMVDEPLRRAMAIRKKCIECCGGSAYEVKKCSMVDCPLWPYRLGRGVTADPAGEIVKTRTVVQVLDAEGVV